MTAAPTPTAADRRVAARRQPAMGTILRLDPAAGGKPATGLVWNISTTGVSMLLPTPPEPGARLSGVLETMADAHTLAVEMKVVHVKLLETGDYFIGAHLDRPLSDADMKPFVA